MSENGSKPRVLVIGEVVVDLIPSSFTPDGDDPEVLTLEGRFGGSPANVAVGLARLQVPSAMGARLSTSGYGPWLRRRLEREGVELIAAVEAEEAATLAVVTLDRSGNASYDFYGPTSADFQWTAAELPPVASLDSSVVHTGSLATVLEPGASHLLNWAAGLRARDSCLISYDPNPRPSIVDRDRTVASVDRWIPLAHLVKASDEDLANLYPGQSVDSVAEKWIATGGPQLLVVTLGDQGAVAFSRSGIRLSLPALPADVVDTVGAGDSFTSGLLWAMSQSGLLSLEALAELDRQAVELVVSRALMVASITVGRPGADPPTLGGLRLPD